MTTPYRLQHRLRMRYTTLLQRRASVGLTPDEATEFALLLAQVNALDAPLYASWCDAPPKAMLPREVS